MDPNRRYIDPRKAAQTWRPKSGVMSTGLKRAREAFFVRNVLTGIVLGAFAVGVYTYSIRAVRQDDFGDIDDEARRVQQEDNNLDRVRPTVLTVGEEKSVMERAAKAVAKDVNIATMGMGSDESSSMKVQGSVLEEITAQQQQSRETRRGVLVGLLENTVPGALDPARKTLVWGAPDVDNIGRVSSRK